MRRLACMSAVLSLFVGCAAQSPDVRGGEPVKAADVSPAQRKASISKEALEYLAAMCKVGQADRMQAVPWLLRLNEAEMELAPDKAGKIAAMESLISRLDELVKYAQSLHDGRKIGRLSVLEIEYYRADAEGKLAGLRGE